MATGLRGVVTFDGVVHHAYESMMRGSWITLCRHRFWLSDGAPRGLADAVAFSPAMVTCMACLAAGLPCDVDGRT